MLDLSNHDQSNEQPNCNMGSPKKSKNDQEEQEAAREASQSDGDIKMVAETELNDDLGQNVASCSPSEQKSKLQNHET